MAEFINGRAYKQDELLTSGKYPVLRVGNFYTNDKWYYSDLELPEKYYAEKGDLLYTWSATFGPHIWIGPKVIYHYHIWKVALKNLFEKDFALQFFEADRVRLLNSTNGSTMIHVTKKDMESKGILLPDVYEQRTIGELLKRVDDLIAATQDKIDALEQAKKALLQRLFDQSWRFKGYSDPWEKRCLSDVLKVNSGRDYKHLSAGTIPVYGTGGYMLSVNKALSNQNAIGIGRKGTIDRPYLLNAPFWTVDTLFYLTMKAAAEIAFVFPLLQRVHWKKLDESTGVPSLSKRVIETLSVYVPDKKEQRAIGNLFFFLDTLIAATQSRLSSLELLKKALLQDLFI
uniref:restriction endonuclease subunit S n=1 Tax=Lacticaseibacillus paracasei TaxID=1597 RepID=UPI00403F03C3